MQVLALDVLDDRQLEYLLIISLPNDNRNGGQPGQRGGSPSALTCNDLIFVRRRPPNNDRLNDAIALHRLGEFQHSLFVEVTPRLVWIRFDLSNRNLHDIAIRYR